MPPPPPMECEVEGCDFKTPENLATNDQVLQRLSLHFNMKHGGNNTPAQVPRSKPDKLKRPSVSEGITEADWVWFEDRWNRYKKSTGVEGEDAVNPALGLCYKRSRQEML